LDLALVDARARHRQIPVDHAASLRARGRSMSGSRHLAPPPQLRVGSTHRTPLADRAWIFSAPRGNAGARSTVRSEQRGVTASRPAGGENPVGGANRRGRRTRRKRQTVTQDGVYGDAETVRRILTDTGGTWAVVGLSNNPSRAAYGVASVL